MSLDKRNAADRATAKAMTDALVSQYKAAIINAWPFKDTPAEVVGRFADAVSIALAGNVWSENGLNGFGPVRSYARVDNRHVGELEPGEGWLITFTAEQAHGPLTADVFFRRDPPRGDA